MSTQRLRDACASLDADVLGLQEIDRGQSRSHGADQTAEVADALGAGHWKFVPALIGEPGGAWRAAATEDDGDGGPAEPGEPGESPEPGYGVGLVSRRPVRAWHSLRLPPPPGRWPVVVPGGAGRKGGVVFMRDEPRAAVAADLGDLVVATAHLSFVPGWNLRQLRQVVRWLARLGPPTVLVGDFNVPGPLPRLVSGWRALAHVKTFPAGRPRLQVDHALGHGPLPAVAGAEARLLPVSDHRALIVALGSLAWP